MIFSQCLTLITAVGGLKCDQSHTAAQLTELKLNPVPLIYTPPVTGTAAAGRASA